jgi:predicted O-methyltransferase YrrM
MTLSEAVRWRYERSVRPRWRRPAAALIRSVAALPSISIDKIAPEIVLASPIMDDICMPPYYAFAHNDYEPLMRIAASVQPRLIIELGTAHGNTVANLCRQFTNSRIITVNSLPEQQTGETTTFSLDDSEIGRVYRRFGYAGRVVQVLQNTLTLDLSMHTPINSADLAIVDACHDRRFVENDFLKVASYVRPGGIVLLHDTDASMEHHLWGSYIACVVLRRRGYDVRHVQGTWWGIWQKPVDEPSAVNNHSEVF